MTSTNPNALRIDLPMPHASYVAAVGALGDAFRNSWVHAVARAVASSPAWGDMPGAKLMAFHGTDPHLVAIGRFDDAGLARLEALQTLVTRHLPHIRYLTYADVERSVSVLAGRIRELIGEERLSDHHFVGVPRGGLIVLGMLAYAMGLEPEQVVPGPIPDGSAHPVVVVDDVAVSGNRFLRWLDEKRPARPVVLGTLFSAPQLREAAAADPRVDVVVSAHDLRDLAPEFEGDGYEAWKERWLSREARGGTLFVGQTEHVCFPWNEPDIGTWNPVLNRVERAWHLVPPELCLKHRSGASERAPEVIIPPGYG